VDHENLLAKLHFCGIRGVSEDYFRSCLANRRQKAAVQTRNRAQYFLRLENSVEHGVYEGSILVPLFIFIYIYIYDLCLRINFVSEQLLLAGDMSVIISS
jgi:hypothetical protein